MFEGIDKKVDDAMVRAVAEAKVAGTWTQTKTKGREHGAARCVGRWDSQVASWWRPPAP